MLAQLHPSSRQASGRRSLRVLPHRRRTSCDQLAAQEITASSFSAKAGIVFQSQNSSIAAVHAICSASAVAADDASLFDAVVLFCGTPPAGDFSFCRASAPLHSCLQFTATSLEAEDEVRFSCVNVLPRFSPPSCFSPLGARPHTNHQVRRKWGASAALDGVRSFSNVTTMHGIDGESLPWRIPVPNSQGPPVSCVTHPSPAPFTQRQSWIQSLASAAPPSTACSSPSRTAASRARSTGTGTSSLGSSEPCPQCWRRAGRWRSRLRGARGARRWTGRGRTGTRGRRAGDGWASHQSRKNGGAVRLPVSMSLHRDKTALICCLRVVFGAAAGAAAGGGGRIRPRGGPVLRQRRVERPRLL